MIVRCLRKITAKSKEWKRTDNPVMLEKAETIQGRDGNLKKTVIGFMRDIWQIIHKTRKNAMLKGTRVCENSKCDSWHLKAW